MNGHFQALLKGIVYNPQQPITQLPLLTSEEQQQLLVEWNDTFTEYPQDKCIHELFEEQVKRTPEAVAIVFEEEQFTYRELNNKANQLGHYLQKLGVKPDVLVGYLHEAFIRHGGRNPRYSQSGWGLRTSRSQLSSRALQVNSG